MEIKICHNKNEWLKQESNDFLQSWDWGEFQYLVGREVLRLQMLEKGEVMGQMQGTLHRLPGLGKYLYIPRVHSSQFSVPSSESVGLSLITELEKNNIIFLRVESMDKNFELRTQNSELVFNRQPAQTLILDINKSETELLGLMHPKTRYNIHLAVRKGVVVKAEKNVKVFWQLNKKTTERDQFKSHDKKYYQKMLECPFAQQLIAYYNNQPIASNILITYKGVATYLHGASGNESRNLMAPYLLQWEGIKLAKNLGCKKYDFWGVAPQAREGNGQSTCFHNYCWEVNHRWTGVTRFKAGFGGKYVEYPQAIEIPVNQFKYQLFNFLKQILKILTKY